MPAWKLALAFVALAGIASVLGQPRTAGAQAASATIEVEEFNDQTITRLETESVCPDRDPVLTCATPDEVFITVTVEDEDGNPAAGVEVLGLAETGFLQAGDDETACGQNDGEAPEDGDPDDDDPLKEEVNTDAEGVASFVFCVEPGDKLGPTTVTFIVPIEGTDEPDFIESVDFTIVGPAEQINLVANPTSLTCGEKTRITGTVRDAIGQTVSPGTRIQMFTNFGGVAVSTGASAGGYGGLAEATIDSAGSFSVFLLTSSANAGPYEVVASVGTPAHFAQVTVTCRLAATPTPQATAAAGTAATGTIRPPSTGDGGLLGPAGGSGAPFVLSGVLALVIALGAGVRLIRP